MKSALADEIQTWLASRRSATHKQTEPAEPHGFLAGETPLTAPEKEKKRVFLLSLWSGLRGSNPPPPPWQGGALPNELNPRGIFV